ncbi:MAG: DUF1272 domain-containing protein [Magnetovibrio sp.]|nr:DUF1272 domain-containing protein [Magnetovibrio sp.]
MLDLRPNCECCDINLPPDSPNAKICTFECTFCTPCAEDYLSNTCPNCGGNLATRPIRPTAALQTHPASKTRIVKQEGCI